MKKSIFFLLLLLKISDVYCQKVIPDFSSNATLYDSTYNAKFFKYISKFDFSISLRSSGHWYRSTQCLTIAKENDQWVQFLFLTDIYNKKHNKINRNKVKIINSICDQKICDSVVNELIKSKLFTLNLDSLQIDYKQINDTIREVRSISDGVLYEFMVRSNNKTRIVSSYQPKSYYEWLPEIIERKYFIDCINAFNYLWKKQKYR